MTPTINIVIPEQLTIQQNELEAALAGIAAEEAKLAAQRKDVQTALGAIGTAIAVLSGKPFPPSKLVPGDKPARRPMSEEAKARIAEGLRRAREAKAQTTQQDAVSGISAPEPPTPEPTGDDVPPENDRAPKASRKRGRIQ